MPDSPRYWFPAKRYGWGWGLPATWQGWLVMIVWLAMLIAGGLRLMPGHPVQFLLLAAVLAVLLGCICYITGEPPRWRGGGRDD